VNSYKKKSLTTKNTSSSDDNIVNCIQFSILSQLINYVMKLANWITFNGDSHVSHKSYVECDSHIFNFTNDG